MSLFNRYNLKDVLKIKTALSNDMMIKIELWNEILNGTAPWNGEAKPCGLVGTTVGLLANPISEEVDVTAPNNERLDESIKKLNEKTKELIQNAVCLGGSIVRPIYAAGKMQFEIEKLGNYIPTRYDLDGTLTGAIITKTIQDGDKKFILIERHDYENKNHSIGLELYRIKGETLIKCNLDECSQTVGMTPFYTWENVEKPFIVEIKNRIPNNVDGSLVPVAIWQNTENLLEDADRQYSRILWEQEGGELVVFADADLFKKRQVEKNGKGEKVLTPKLNKLLVKIDGNGTDSEKITEHAPNLRTAQQVEAFNQILRRCELAWNVGKGSLSDLEEAKQTATQYTGGKKTLYTTVDTLESEIEEKYRHIAYIFAYMLSAYENIPFNDEINVTYNDTIRKDAEQLRAAALMELQNGIISKAEYRMRVFGEDETTAQSRVPPEVASDSIGGMSFFN